MKVTDSLGNFMTVEDVLRKDFESVCRDAQFPTDRTKDGEYRSGHVATLWACYLRGARTALSIQQDQTRK